MTMAEVTVAIMLFIAVVSAQSEPKFDKHSIDMNPDAYRGAVKKRVDIEASIGQFLEITCPQYDQETPKHEMSLYYLYEFKTDEKSFKECNLTKRQIVLPCDSPYKTTKLTVKFQRTSPYPLGFTFKEGETYYYIAVPKGDKDCRNGVPLTVAVKKSSVVVPPMRTVERTKSSSTTLRTSTFSKAKTSSKSTTRKSVLLSSVINSGAQVGPDGGNGATSVQHFTLVTSFVALLALWFNG